MSRNAKQLSLDTAALPILPEGWCWATLETVSRIEGGITKDQKRPRTSTMREVPYLRVANVQRGFLDLEEMKTILAEEDEIRSLRLQDGDILFTEGGDRDKLGRGWVWNGEIAECIHQNHIFRARPCRLAVEPKFISYHGNYFGQKWFVRTGKQTTNLASINKGVLSRFPVPMAPTNEQRRIVAKIEELFSDLDAGVAALERAKAKLKRYRAAVLKAAVEGHLAASHAHEVSFARTNWQPLSDIVLSLEQGWSPKCERENSDDPKEWVVIKTTAIQQLQFLEHENKRLPSALHPRQELELQAGDLLITRAGPRNRAGVTCLVRRTRPRVILCDKAYRIRLSCSVVEPGYVEIVLNSPPILDILDELKTGISDSGVNLTQNRLLQLHIPIPPIGTQKAIEQEVLRLLSIVDVAEKEIASSMKHSARLRQSILKRAFEGNLVPQDRNDEPASVLLERIKSASGNNGQRKRVRRHQSTTA